MKFLLVFGLAYIIINVCSASIFSFYPCSYFDPICNTLVS
jgi:hypothetical protein